MESELTPIKNRSLKSYVGDFAIAGLFLAGSFMYGSYNRNNISISSSLDNLFQTASKLSSPIDTFNLPVSKDNYDKLQIPGLENKIKKYEKNYNCNISVSIIQNDLEYSYKSDEKRNLGSQIKPFCLLACLDLIDRGINSEYLFKLPIHDLKSNKYSVIKKTSDKIIEDITYFEFEKIMFENNISIDLSNKLISTNELSTFYYDLFQGNVIDSDFSFKMLNELSQSKLNSKLSSYLPKNILVINNQASELNSESDSAIVYSKNPYVISINVSNNNSKQNNEVWKLNANEIIRQISKDVYTNLNYNKISKMD